MSGKLQIQFASDMPGSVVEVLAPNLETAGRVWLGPGSSAVIDVPSEASFLRLHLPSGKTITLHDPGNLKRQISLATILQATGIRSHTWMTGRRPRQTMAELRSSHQARERSMTSIAGQSAAADTFQLGDGTQIRLTANGVSVLTGTVDADSYEAILRPSILANAYDLSVATSSGELHVRIPGRTKQLYVTVDAVNDDLRVLGVRVRTEDEMADTLGNYITRGDLHSAASMTSWVEGAEEMLLHKAQDPCAAALCAYLLLRLRRLDLMRTWAKTLADQWPDLADGSIIWAWQQIYERGSEAEIRQYFEKAASADPPVFTEGLKLLGDGLRLLEGHAGQALRKLNAVGLVLWDSPFTTHVPSTQAMSGQRWKFDVAYAAPA